MQTHRKKDHVKTHEERQLPQAKVRDLTQACKLLELGLLASRTRRPYISVA